MGITLYDLNAQRAMLKRGEEKRKAARQAEERERLRDTFAAAALTGLLANGDYNPSTPVLAFRMADAMLRERARNGSVEGCETVQSDHIPDAGKMVETPGEIDKYRRFIGEVMNWISEATGFLHDDVLRTDDARDTITNACSQCWDAFNRIAYPTTNHDAAPAARAEESMKEPNGSSTGEPGGEPESTIRTGDINELRLLRRAVRQLLDGINECHPDKNPREWVCQDMALLDALVPPDHDAAPAARASESPCAGHAGTGGTPVTKPMPVFVSGSGSVTPVAYQENDEKRVFYDTTGGQSDRTQPIENGPDADSRVWETPAKTDTTPPRNGKPTEGSVPGEGSVPDSRNWKEPVAWAVEKKGYPPMFAVFNDWNFACRAAMEEYAEIVPLYRHPPCQDLLQKNLTDEELEAVRSAFRLPAQPLCSVVLDMGERPDCADTLRNLLERIGGER
jgi:hypothetical protein